MLFMGGRSVDQAAAAESSTQTSVTGGLSFHMQPVINNTCLPPLPLQIQYTFLHRGNDTAQIDAQTHAYILCVEHRSCLCIQTEQTRT